MRSEIEKVQPYNVPHSEFPPALGLLGALDIIDKHRTLNVMAAVPHSANIKMIHSRQGATLSGKFHRTAVEGKTEILHFTVEPPDPDLSFKCEATIVICVSHPPGPSKSPFSELAGVLDTLIAEVERIVAALETVAGQVPGTVPVNLNQSVHFSADKDGQLTLREAEAAAD